MKKQTRSIKQTKSRRNRTKKYSKKQGVKPYKGGEFGDGILKESMVGYLPAPQDTEKTGKRSKWLKTIRRVKNEKIYFYFYGTSCSNNGTKTNKILSTITSIIPGVKITPRKLENERHVLQNHGHRYGAVFCRGNIVQQVLTSISTVTEGFLHCDRKPLKLSPFIGFMKRLITELLKNRNKVFLYGHSYGGTLVTKIMRSMPSSDNLYGRTFGAPVAQKYKNLLHFVYENDDVISEHIKCNNLDSVKIPLKIEDITGTDYEDLKEKLTLNYMWFWKSYYSFMYHNAYYGPFMEYVIKNIDNKDTQLPSEEVQLMISKEMKGGLFGSNLAKRIIDYYSF